MQLQDQAQTQRQDQLLVPLIDQVQEQALGLLKHAPQIQGKKAFQKQEQAQRLQNPQAEEHLPQEQMWQNALKKDEIKGGELTPLFVLSTTSPSEKIKIQKRKLQLKWRPKEQ